MKKIGPAVAVRFVMPMEVFGDPPRICIGNERDLVMVELSLCLATTASVIASLAFSYIAWTGDASLILPIDLIFAVMFVGAGTLYVRHSRRVVMVSNQLEVPHEAIRLQRGSYVWCFLYVSMGSLLATYAWSVAAIG